MLAGALALVGAWIMAWESYPRDPYAHLLGWGTIFFLAVFMNYGSLLYWFAKDAGLTVSELVGTDDFDKRLPWRHQAAKYRRDDEGVVKSGKANLDIVEREIQPGSRGTRVFPFNRIEIAVLAPSREARGRLEAVFAGDPPLPARIVQRLQSGGCPTADIVVSIDYAARGQKKIGRAHV